jgi:hypothetical protein
MMYWLQLLVMSPRPLQQISSFSLVLEPLLLLAPFGFESSDLLVDFINLFVYNLNLNVTLASITNYQGQFGFLVL